MVPAVLGGLSLWFFWLDLTIKNPKYIIHSPLDDSIPFNEWFVFPYCSWFLLLAGVTALLWWYDTASYDKLCLSMFAGMTFCLIVYMVLPNGLDIRPTAEAVGRSNIAMRILQLLWSADASVNVCPSITARAPPAWRWRSAAVPSPRSARAEGAGLGMGRAHLCVHGVHQAALHRGCGVRPCRGLCLGAGAVPSAQEKQLRKEPAKTSGFP